jgi:hypothetical protein
MLLREQTSHLLAALHSEGIEALAAELRCGLGLIVFVGVDGSSYAASSLRGR